MTRHYSLVIEGEEGSYSAYVAELQTILVTGKTIDELTGRAEEAITAYLSALGIGGTFRIAEDSEYQ